MNTLPEHTSSTHFLTHLLTTYDRAWIRPVLSGKELLEEDFIVANPAWRKELQMMVNSKVKAEIQARTKMRYEESLHSS